MTKTIIERRIVIQDLYRTETTKTRWDSYGWVFKDCGSPISRLGFELSEILESDKYGNPILGVAEKTTKYEIYRSI